MISKKEMERLATHMNLYMTDEETEHFAKDLSQMIDTISIVSTAELRETQQEERVFASQDWREDEVKQSLEVEAVLSNAPHKKEGYFLVTERV